MAINCSAVTLSLENNFPITSLLALELHDTVKKKIKINQIHMFHKQYYRTQSELYSKLQSFYLFALQWTQTHTDIHSDQCCFSIIELLILSVCINILNILVYIFYICCVILSFFNFLVYIFFLFQL